MRRLTHALALAGLTLLVGTTAGGAAGPDPALPATVSEKIIADLGRADLDAFAADASKYMAASVTDRLKNNFASIKDLGQSQYSELLYSRDFGQTEKDIIYKIDFDKAFAFVRFLWHVDNGNWHLIHLNYKTEEDLPLPKGWEHIYLK
jgi:hypothetical protein